MAEEENRGLMGILNRWAERKQKISSLNNRVKNYKEGKIALLKAAFKEKANYPPHDKKILEDIEKKLMVQEGRISMLLFVLMCAGVGLVSAKYRLTKKTFYSVPVILISFIIIADMSKNHVYLHSCEELLMRAKNLKEKDQSMLLRQARMKYNLRI